MAESYYEYMTSDDWACVSSNETKIINHIKKMKAQYPNDVTIQHYPEKNSGVIVARVPRSWIKKPSPPRKQKPMSPEELEAVHERLKTARIQSKNQARIDEDDEDE